MVQVKPPSWMPKPPKAKPPKVTQPYYEPKPGWHSPTSPEFEQIARQQAAGAGQLLPTGGMSVEDVVALLGGGVPTSTTNGGGGGSRRNSAAAAAAAAAARANQLKAIEDAYTKAGTNIGQAYSGGQAELQKLMAQYSAAQQAQALGARKSLKAFGVAPTAGVPDALSASDYLAALSGNMGAMSASDRANIDATLAAYRAALGK